MNNLNEIHKFYAGYWNQDFAPFVSTNPTFDKSKEILKKVEPFNDDLNFSVYRPPHKRYDSKSDERILYLSNKNKKFVGYCNFSIYKEYIKINDVMIFKSYKGRNLAVKMYKLLMNKFNKPIQSDFLQTPNGQRLWYKLSQDDEVDVFGYVDINKNLVKDYRKSLQKIQAEFYKELKDDLTYRYLFPVRKLDTIKRLSTLANSDLKLYTGDRSMQDDDVSKEPYNYLGLMALPKGKKLTEGRLDTATQQKVIDLYVQGEKYDYIAQTTNLTNRQIFSVINERPDKSVLEKKRNENIANRNNISKRIAQIKQLYSQGYTIQDIAKKTNVHHTTIIRRLRKLPDFDNIQKERQKNMFTDRDEFRKNTRRGIQKSHIQKIIELYSQGYNMQQIANSFGVTANLIKFHLKSLSNYNLLKQQHDTNKKNPKDKLLPILVETPKEEGGDCFEVAGRKMIYENMPGMKLVHAYVSGQGPLKGRRFEHAWNEIGDVVIDSSNGKNIILRKEIYYKLGKVKQTKGQYASYTHPEALAKMVEHHHYGPWDLDENVTENTITEQQGYRLKDLCEIKTNFPDADFWLKRVDSIDNIGKPVKEFNKENIGIKVIKSDILNSDYLYYAMQGLHNKGYWRKFARGILNLVHIEVKDVKNLPVGY